MHHQRGPWLLLNSVDFYPTFLEAAGGKNSTGKILDGVSLMPLLKNKKAPERDAMFWHYISETGKWKPRMGSAVRKGDLKLIEFYQDKRLELYNIKNDFEHCYSYLQRRRERKKCRKLY